MASNIITYLSSPDSLAEHIEVFDDHDNDDDDETPKDEKGKPESFLKVFIKAL